MPFTATRDISYGSDAAAIFDALAQPHDSLLLESADIGISIASPYSKRP